MVIEFKNESFTVWEEKYPGLMGVEVLLPTGSFTIEGDHEALGMGSGLPPGDGPIEGKVAIVYRVRPGHTVITMQPRGVRWLVWVPDIQFPYPRVCVIESASGSRVNVVLGETFPRGLRKDQLDGTVRRARGRWRVKGLEGRQFYSRSDAEDMSHYLTKAADRSDVWWDSDEVATKTPLRMPRWGVAPGEKPTQWQHLLRNTDD